VANHSSKGDIALSHYTLPCGLVSDNFFPARAGIRRFIRRHIAGLRQTWLYRDARRLGNLLAPRQVIHQEPTGHTCLEAGLRERSYAWDHIENRHRRRHDRCGCQRRRGSAIESIDRFERIPYLRARRPAPTAPTLPHPNIQLPVSRRDPACSMPGVDRALPSGRTCRICRPRAAVSSARSERSPSMRVRTKLMPLARFPSSRQSSFRA
jgi:hypothetical protein